MAGRIRSIKPEMLDDTLCARLSDAAWRAFVSMWLEADDYGNLPADAERLHARFFWSGSPRDMEAVLRELKPFVRIYEVRGQQYANIRNWPKHQKVDKPGKPKWPSPPPESTSEARIAVAELSRAEETAFANIRGTPESIRGTPAPEGRGEEGKGNGEEGKGAEARRASPMELTTEAGEVLGALHASRDLWPPMYVGDNDLRALAFRVGAKIRADPKMEGDHAFVAEQMIGWARAYKAKHPSATAELLLAEAERKAGWIQRDYQTGKIVRPPKPKEATTGSRERRAAKEAAEEKQRKEAKANQEKFIEAYRSGRVRLPDGMKPRTVDDDVRERGERASARGESEPTRMTFELPRPPPPDDDQNRSGAEKPEEGAA